MEQWTCAEPTTGRFNPHINHGGMPFWCMFDYAIRPAPKCGGIEFVLAEDADPDSRQWYPHLLQGFERGLEAERDRGHIWVGVEVEIRKIHTHPNVTTVSGCEFYGASFVCHVLPHYGLQIPIIREGESGDA